MNEINDLARNVRRVRRALDMSQSALAEAASISESAVKRLEGEKAVPNMRIVQAIAKALDVNLRDLFSPVKPLHAVRFRSRKKLRLRENILADASRWLSDFNEIENNLCENKPFKLIKLVSQNSSGRITEHSQNCRDLLGLKPAEPIHDITGLLEEAGIKIYPIEIQSEDFFGLSIGENDGGPAIVVNEWDRISVERRIFTVAHELGHILLHLDAFDVDKASEDENQEKEANLFAAHFLMPADGFLKEWREASGLYWVDRVLKVKRIFHVSYGTVLKRMVELGWVDEREIWINFRYACKKRFGKPLSSKEEPQGLKADEPYKLVDFDFCEDRLSRLVRQAVESEKISLSRGAEILRIGIESMRERLMDWESAR
jgi:Zn-dependent peptidase ImmA (M78 family)/DNA-binding XRE family transcriptional regulator